MSWKGGMTSTPTCTFFHTEKINFGNDTHTHTHIAFAQCMQPWMFKRRIDSGGWLLLCRQCRALRETIAK